MAGPTRQISFRLRPEGGAEIVNEVRKVEEAGVKANAAVGAAAERATAAAERQEAQWRRNAEAMRMAAQAAQAQSSFNTVLGVGGSGKSAADSFAVFAANDDDAGRAAAIRAQIDPLAAAQDRYNRELAETNRLRAAGHLSEDEAIRQQNLLQRELDQTTAALARNTGGLTRNQMASRLNLSRQAADVAVTAAMGMNPAMIAMQQGPQIADAWATAGIRAGGAMLAMAGGIALAGGAATAAVLAWRSGEKQSLMLERAVTGLGRTAGLTAAELEALAMASAEQGEVSIRSAREQAAAYVSTGKIGGEVIAGLIAIGKDYAAVMGLEAEEATQSLAKAMTEPDKAARELTRQIGLLDQKTLDHIDTLVKHGDRLAAQKILLDALSESVDGQADRIGSIETAWDAAARAVSNYWDKLGRALYTTPDERVANAQRAVEIAYNNQAAGKPTPPGEIARLTAIRDRLVAEQRERNAIAEQAAAQAAANQAAQEAEDRKTRPRSNRSAEREAEREAREALQRQRREEDRAWQIEMEVSRARGDTDHVRALEEEEAIRSRIRDLVDDGASQEDARFTAMQEQARLNEAALAATEREVGLLFDANVLAVDRILGMDRYVAEQERAAELQDLINTYHETELSLAEATKKATADQLAIDEARAEVLERQVASAERDHALELARLSGRTGVADSLDREKRIEARAREIEARENLNRGEGEGRATREIDELIAAEARGGMREGLKGFIDDIRRGGIRDALADQFEQATDRLVDRLIDALFDMDWSGFMGGGKGQSGGGGFWGSIAGAVGSLFSPGRNARGTDHWSGGWTWVGEEGPELIRAPRGAQIADADRSRRMAAMGAGGGPQYVDKRTFHFSGNLLTPEWWAEINKRDRAAAQAGADHGAAVAVSTVPSTAPAVQRADAMMRG